MSIPIIENDINIVIYIVWYKVKIEGRLTKKSVESVDDITLFEAFAITFIFRLLYIFKAIKGKYNRKESANEIFLCSSECVTFTLLKDIDYLQVKLFWWQSIQVSSWRQCFCSLVSHIYDKWNIVRYLGSNVKYICWYCIFS